MTVNYSFASLTIGSGGVAIVLTAKYKSKSCHQWNGMVSSCASEYNGLCQGGASPGESTTGQTKVYVDGALEDTIVLNQGGSLDTSGTLIVGQEQDVVRGGFQDSQKFVGDVDEVALYGTALSEEVCNHVIGANTLTIRKERCCDGEIGPAHVELGVSHERAVGVEDPNAHHAGASDHRRVDVELEDDLGGGLGRFRAGRPTHHHNRGKYTQPLHAP